MYKGGGHGYIRGGERGKLSIAGRGAALNVEFSPGVDCFHSMALGFYHLKIGIIIISFSMDYWAQMK